MIRVPSHSARALLLALAAHPLSAQAPAFEYGSPADLKGVTSIFVDTGEDMDTRENIVRIIIRELPNLKVAPRASDAEVVLVFQTGESTSYAGTYTAGSTEAAAEVQPSGAGVQVSAETRSDELAFAIYQTTVSGSGKVFRIVDGGRVRLIMTFQGSKIKGTIWKKPRTKFAEKFVETYKQGQAEQ